MPASKELVEHIRLIHFSLIIACAGLLIAIWTISDSRLAKAKSDLQWLCTEALPKGSPQALEELAYKAAKIPDEAKKVTLEIGKFDGTPEQPLPRPVMSYRNEVLLGLPRAPRHVEDGESVDTLTLTLQELVDFWDSLVPTVYAAKADTFSSDLYVFDVPSSDGIGEDPSDTSKKAPARAAIRKLADGDKYPRAVEPVLNKTATADSPTLGAIVSLDGKGERAIPLPPSSLMVAAASRSGARLAALTTLEERGISHSVNVSVFPLDKAQWHLLPIDPLRMQFPAAAAVALSDDGTIWAVSSVHPVVNRLIRYYVDFYPFQLPDEGATKQQATTLRVPGTHPIAVDPSGRRVVWTQEGKYGLRIGRPPRSSL